MRGELSCELTKSLTMQRNIMTWSWGVQWWFLLYWALFCHGVTGQSSPQKPSRSWHGYHLPRNHERGSGPWHQKPHIHKTYCDPSVNNHTAGDITQRCGAGFYREWSGPHKGQCVPCSCNGLSKECDEHTGNCMKCRFNTAGDRCERCKEGYHGSAAGRTCQPCPCPTTWNNFALACLDVGSGVVECLCKRGYHGATCDRCASGYHGNPKAYGGNCQPCHCSDGTSNICDTLTGKCITSGANGSGDHCLHDCDNCSLALLEDLEGMDDEMAWLKKQLQNISQSAVSLTMLNRLQANISETKVVVGKYISAVNALLPKTEQLEADMDLVSDDLTQLTDKIQKTVPGSDKLVKKVNRTKVKAGDLVSEVQSLSIPIQTLLKQLSELKPGDSSAVDAEDASRMLTEVQKMLEEMRANDCTTHTGTAANEREMARKLLQQIRNNMTALADMNQSSANGTTASLMSAGSSLRDLADMLSNAQLTVDRSLGLNLNSDTILHDLLKRRAQLRKERDKIPPMVGLTKDKLRNTTELYGMLKESKKEAEHLAAQQDGAEMNLTKKLNRISQVLAKVDLVIKAEDHAEELDRLARELQLGLQKVTNSSSDLFNAVVSKGAHSSIISAIEEAGMAANQSRVAAEEAFKDTVQGGVVKRAKELKDDAHRMLTEVQNTPGNLQMISDQVTSHTNNIDQRKEKGQLLRNDIQHVSDDLNKIKRDDTGSLLDAAKAAVSASNATINSVTVRLRTITQEVGKISLPDASPNVDGILSDADHALKSLSETLPTLNKTFAQTQDLSNQAPPAANLTESIRRIKDIIQETRTFVNRLSLATTFNGKGHVELRPPSNIEDVKAFTAVDLLLNRHPKDPSKAEGRRRRRQDRRHDSNAFVFYLGNKDSAGDYIGMAIRNNILVCVYKLGGIVHKVEASKIITTNSVNSTDFDRVVFRRVYQDAEVNMTQNFTSPKPIHLPLKKNLPNTAIAVLDLNPDNVVFYVGGHPDDFTPPVELRYPKYRGAMKLSSVNDHRLCLFNYKSVVNLTDDQPYVKLTQSEVSDYYEGTGYRMALTSNPDKIKRRLFKFTIKSRVSNALLFYIGNDDSYFCVLVEKGHLVLQGRQAGRALKAQSSGSVSLYGGTFIIEMDKRFTIYYGEYGREENISTNYVASRYRNYYVGGLPTQLRERDNITAPALRGCVDRWRVDGLYVEYNRTIGVSVGCPVALLGVHESAFKSGGSLSLNSTGLSSQRPAMVSLGFRSTEKHGALLRTTYQDSDFQLSLTDGYVVFNYDSQALKSRKMYNDGRWHFLSAGKYDTGLELRVDNVDMGQQQPHKVKPRTHELTLAGETFKGCMANLYTRNPMSFMPADLSSSSAKGDVVLGTCNLSPHATLLPAALLQKPHRYKMMRSQTDTTAVQCRRPSAHYGGYQLSERNSWLSYNISPEDLNYRPHFSLEVRTRSSKGLLLYVAGKGVVPLVALFIANGKIKLSLGPNRIIQSNKKSNDGNWHRVVFSVEKNTFHLLVDGVRVTDGLLSNGEGSSLNLKNPVYLGGYPRHKTSKSHFIPKGSVIGCVRDFRLNEILVGEPVSSHGSLPCSDVLSESGAYFGGNGGHVVLDKSFNVGSHFELTFELRPRLLTGLLFHVSGRKTSLDVYLRDNKVGVEVNDGNDVLSLLLTPQQNLCDGKFHLVAVSKQNEVLKLEVDSVREQIEGFSRSRSYSAALDSLYIGGVSGKGQRNRAPVSTSFVGCLRNVKLNAKPAAFETSRVTGPVHINKCPAD